MFARNKKSWRKHCKTSIAIHSSERTANVLDLANHLHRPEQKQNKTVTNISTSQEFTSANITRDSIRGNNKRQATLTEINMQQDSRRREYQLAKQDEFNPGVNIEYSINNKRIAIDNSSNDEKKPTNVRIGRDKSSTMRRVGNRSMAGNGHVGMKMKQCENKQSVRSSALLAQTYCCPMMASVLLTLLAYALQQTVQVGSVGE